jgi:hypothetical protein
MAESFRPQASSCTSTLDFAPLGASRPLGSFMPLESIAKRVMRHINKFERF